MDLRSNFRLMVLAVILSAINCSPNEYTSYPKTTNSFRSYSTQHEQSSGTKLSPNGAAVKQWETRSWISTIPLQKATSDHRETSSGISKSREPAVVTASSTPSQEDYDYHLPPPSSISSKYSNNFRDSDPRDPRNYPIVNHHTNITHTIPSSPSSPSSLSSMDDSSEKPCHGENCRKSPFQGTYDTTNYQKKMVYPDKYATASQHSSEDFAPGYPRRYRSEYEEEDDGGHEGDSQWNQSPPRKAPRSSRWDSNDHGHWDKKEYSGPVSREVKKSYRSFTHSEDDEPWQEKRKSKEPVKSRFEPDHRDYEREKDRDWGIPSNRGGGGSGGGGRSSEYSMDDEKPEPVEQPKKTQKKTKTKSKNKPKVRHYHHDEETPDGYSHAHGYEKEEVEGTRFFDPVGLTGQEEGPRHHHHYHIEPVERKVKDEARSGKSNEKCDCSARKQEPHRQDDSAERISKIGKVKRFELSGEELDHGPRNRFHSESGEFHEQESTSTMTGGMMPKPRLYSNTTRT